MLECGGFFFSSQRATNTCTATRKYARLRVRDARRQPASSRDVYRHRAWEIPIKRRVVARVVAPRLPAPALRAHMSTRAFARLLQLAAPGGPRSARARRRLSTVDASTGSGIDDALHQHAREDMYFRAEDVRLLQGLVNKAHAQARARSTEKAEAENAEAHDLAALEAIVGKGTLSEATARAVVAWKHG